MNASQPQRDIRRFAADNGYVAHLRANDYGGHDEYTLDCYLAAVTWTRDGQPACASISNGHQITAMVPQTCTDKTRHIRWMLNPAAAAPPLCLC